MTISSAPTMAICQLCRPSWEEKIKRIVTPKKIAREAYSWNLGSSVWVRAFSAAAFFMDWISTAGLSGQNFGAMSEQYRKVAISRGRRPFMGSRMPMTALPPFISMRVFRVTYVAAPLPMGIVPHVIMQVMPRGKMTLGFIRIPYVQCKGNNTNDKTDHNSTAL